MVHISDNFNEEVIKYEGRVIVDFWAPWCGPCKMFGPVFEEVSKKREDIKFCKLNVDEDNDISKSFGVMSIPTIILFENGKELKRNIGFLNEKDLLKFLED